VDQSHPIGNVGFVEGLTSVNLTFALTEKVISTRKAERRCCSHFDKLEANLSLKTKHMIKRYV